MILVAKTKSDIILVISRRLESTTGISRTGDQGSNTIGRGTDRERLRRRPHKKGVYGSGDTNGRILKHAILT